MVIMVKRVLPSDRIEVGGMIYSRPKWATGEYIWVSHIDDRGRVIGRNIESYSRSIRQEVRPIGVDLHRVVITTIRSRYGDYVKEDIGEELDSEKEIIHVRTRDRIVRDIGGVDHVFTLCEIYKRFSVSLKIEGVFFPPNNFVKQGKKYIPLTSSIADIKYKLVGTAYRLDYAIV